MIYQLKNVHKSFNDVVAIKDLSFDIKEGEIIVILGPSGSGKSTLVNILGGIDTPSTGQVIFDNQDISNYKDNDLTLFRKDYIGFIFQSYHLISNLTIKENIELGKELSKNPLDMDEIMTLLDIKKHENKFPYQLSGGEQQRVSIARSLIKNPKILMCDEPTGALDEKRGKDVLASIVSVNKKYNTTTIIVTHNPSIGLIGDKIIKLNSGEIKEVIINKKRMDVKEINWA